MPYEVSLMPILPMSNVDATTVLLARILKRSQNVVERLKIELHSSSSLNFIHQF